MSNQYYDFVDENDPDWRNVRLLGAGEARESLDEYKIVSVGRRPIDFIGRDLLTGSWLRDQRLWAFRKFSSNCPAWAGQMTADLVANSVLRKQAIQQIGIHFLHKARLAFFRTEADGDEMALRIIDRLWRCWPYGLEFSWQGPTNKPDHDLCRMGRQCVFCFARMVCGLYQRIAAGPLQERENKFLALGRLRRSENILTADLAAGQIRQIKAELTGRLIDEAHALGATGGLATFTVGPSRFDRWEGEEMRAGNDGFTCDAAILASIEAPTPRFLAEVHGQTQPNVDWCFRHASQKNSLRNLLAGTAVSYRGAFSSGGDPGAFFVPPWPLASFEQWWMHYEATKGMHLYDFFGNWKGAVPRTINQSPRTRKIVYLAGPYPGVRRRHIAFKAANSQRSQIALARRDSLLSVTLPVWESLICEIQGRIGWRALARALTDAGHAVSERDARWLAKQLGSSQDVTGTPNSEM